MLLIASFVLLIDRQLAGKIHPDATTLVLIAIGLALIFGLLYPRGSEQLIKRLSILRFGALEVGFLHQVERATVVNRFPDNEEFGVKEIPPRKRTGSISGDLREPKDLLTDRLEWLGRELTDLLNQEGLRADAATPADLVQAFCRQELLDCEQARFALDLLAPDGSDLYSLPRALAEEYIDRAWAFANRLRPAAFDRAVRRDFRKAEWFLADFKQESPHHRPDFLATREGRWLLVAPRIALTRDSASNEQDGQIALTRRRWSNRPNLGGPSLDRWVIVIPDFTEAPESDAPGEPAVIKRSRLPSFLRGISDDVRREVRSLIADA